MLLYVTAVCVYWRTIWNIICSVLINTREIVQYKPTSSGYIRQIQTVYLAHIPVNIVN
jgi:hypothetical protein